MSITFSSAKLVGTSHCMAVRLRHSSLSRTTSFFIYRLPIQETAFFIYRLPFQGTACCFLGQFYRLWHLALIRTRVFYYWQISIPRDAICFLGQFYSSDIPLGNFCDWFGQKQGYQFVERHSLFCMAIIRWICVIKSNISNTQPLMSKHS